MEQNRLNRFYSFLFEKPNYIGIFLLLCFTLSFQTRIVFFTGASQVFGVYAFYHTLFFYLSDFLIIAILILWLYHVIKGQFHVKLERNTLLPGLILLFFWLILVISELVSHETVDVINIFGLFKLFLIFLLFCFTIFTISSLLGGLLCKFDVKHLLYKIFWLILASSVFQGILVVSQYFLQKSLGLKFLGEEYIRKGLPGIASFKILHGYRWIIDQFLDVSREALVIRPYGTFSHPNVMGAFMAFSALLSVYLLYVSRETWKRVLIMFVLALQIFSLVISFSRVAILGFMLAVGFWLALLFLTKHRQKIATYDGKRLRFAVIYTGMVLLLCFGLFYPQFLERTGVVSYGTSNQEALEDRVIYQNIALNMVRQHPLLGVGYQNFVKTMDRYSVAALKDYQHQPVHNIYLLIAAESGMIGLSLFLVFIFLILKAAVKSFSDPLNALLTAIFLSFLFIGLFDHYFFTIQQGRVMFFLTAALLFASASRNASRQTDLP